MKKPAPDATHRTPADAAWHDVDDGQVSRLDVPGRSHTVVERTQRTAGQRIVGFAAGFLLLYFTWTGATGFLRQWPQATGVGQIVQTGSELLYAIGALFCVATTMRWRRWAKLARGAWILGATMAGGLAPTVWGGAPIWLSGVTAAASLGLALAVLWMLRRGIPR